MDECLGSFTAESSLVPIQVTANPEPADRPPRRASQRLASRYLLR